jgi:hypothetical protein
MTLIDNAGQVWHRLWSVRLSLLSAVASAADAGWQAYITGQPRVVSIITFGISLGAAVSRVVAQPKLQGDRDAVS